MEEKFAMLQLLNIIIWAQAMDFYCSENSGKVRAADIVGTFQKFQSFSYLPRSILRVDACKNKEKIIKSTISYFDTFLTFSFVQSSYDRSSL